MTLPDWLRSVLPDDTAESWEKIATILPGGVYLVVGRPWLFTCGTE